MKKIRITYIKHQTIKANGQVVQMIEQNIHTESSEFTIPVFPGYSILSITELLPDIIDKVPPVLHVTDKN